MFKILLISLALASSGSMANDDHKSGGTIHKNESHERWIDDKGKDFLGRDKKEPEEKPKKDPGENKSTSGPYKPNTTRAKESAQEIKKHIEEKGTQK